MTRDRTMPSLHSGRPKTATGPAGEYALAAPPGTVHVRANDDPSTENIGALDPGGTVVLDLTVP